MNEYDEELLVAVVERLAKHLGRYDEKTLTDQVAAMMGLLTHNTLIPVENKIVICGRSYEWWMHGDKVCIRLMAPEERL